MPYEITKSPFYRLERPRDLADLLRVTSIKLERLACECNELYRRELKTLNGKERALSVPTKGLRTVHERIAALLKRILLPEHIRCPRAKATAWASAEVHRGAPFITTFDLKDFHPSTTEEHIFRFWRYEAQMSEDCSRIMSKICTDRGFLPFGSPLSSHLAAHVHLDLFKRAAELAADTGGVLTAWVDDITVSGQSVRRDILNQVREAAARKGLETHKWKRGGGRRGVEVTGVYLKSSSLRVANKGHLRVRDSWQEYRDAAHLPGRLAALHKLLGMLHHQRAVLRSTRSDTAAVDGQLNSAKMKLKKQHLAAKACVTS